MTRWNLLPGVLCSAVLVPVSHSVEPARRVESRTAAPAAAVQAPPQLYEVTTETGMPHLEENLRYTTRHDRVCLASGALGTAFPILDHPALKGCKLQNQTRQAATVTYTLVCEGGHGTTGQAIWHLDEHRIRGTLNVKLGGKNMTFYQRITAVPLGQCPRAASVLSR